MQKALRRATSVRQLEAYEAGTGQATGGARTQN
jgi:hypothetical protein